MSGPLVALIDGPLAQDMPGLAGRRRLVAGDSEAVRAHAAAVAAALREAAPRVPILNLVIFGTRLAAPAGAAAEALREAAAAGAAVALCAFGLARDDAGLAAAARGLAAAGGLLVAAAPARGGPCWPAALPEALAATGDARCAPGQWSRLAPDLWGACPAPPWPGGPAGASIGAARFAGLLAARLPAGEALAALDAGAAFRGRERRGPAA